MRRAVVAVLLAGAMALTGCSGALTGSSGGSGAVDVRVPSPSGSPNGLETRSAAAILDASIAAATKARSVHIVASFVEKKKTIAFDLRLVKGRGARGTMTGPEGRVSVIAVGGKLYAKGSYGFWRRSGGDKRISAVFANRWVLTPGSLSGEDGALFRADFKKIFRDFKVGVKVTKGREAYMDRHRAIGVVEKVDRSTLWVSLDGTPYPLRITAYPKDKTQGSMAFSEWNVAVTLKAPKNPLRMSDLH